MQPLNPNLQTLIDSDARIPIARLTAYATTKSVPSKGANVAYYAVGPDSTMTGNWWEGLPSTAPAGTRDEGTYLAGSNIVEPSSVIAFDFGIGGVPAPVTGRNDLWASRWYGFFFARYSGSYRFYIDLPPFARARIKINGTYYGTTSDGGTLFTNPDGDPSERWTGSDIEKTRQELYFDVGGLVAGTWYDISVEYHVPQQAAPQNVSAYLAVKYREPDSTTDLDLWGNSGGDIVPDYQSDYQEDDGTDIKKPLSAAVFNTTGAFLQGEVIPGVSGFRGVRRGGQVSEYSFEMPLPASSNIDTLLLNGAVEIFVDSVAGFAKEGALVIGSAQASMYVVTYTGIDESLNKFTGCAGVTGASIGTLTSQLVGEGVDKYITGYNPDTGAFGPLPTLGLVQIEGGMYDGVSTDYYTNRIWGNMFPGPEVDRANKTVRYTVSDFTWLLIEQYDRNYPDQASYSLADYYMPNTNKTPDGITRPNCYDRWSIDRAVRDILMKGNIDPILSYQRRRLKVSSVPSFASDYGAYMLSGDLILDSNKLYGHPLALEQTGPDDKYIWSFGYGALLYENLSEVVKNFSYMFGFTGDGFAKCEPFGLPDKEFIDTDSEVTMVNATASWSPQFGTNALSAFKARYEVPDGTPTGAMKAQMSAESFSDLDIVVGRHSAAGQVIKVKVGGVYETELIIDGAIVSGTGGGSDEFDITRSAGDWFFDDGLESSTIWNPSVIRIAQPKTYASRTVELEVVSGLVRFNAFFLYDRSARTVIRTLSDSQMGTLRMSENVADQRNEISVVGAEQGKADTSDGEVINPNNPIFVHTISRAVDLASLYDISSPNYIGQVRSTELFDSHILDQERADSIAIHSLIKYGSKAVTGSTVLLFDPSIEPVDSISITDNHSHLLNETQVWLNDVEEAYSLDSAGTPSYTTALGSFSPREPLTSMRFKPEPDIDDWDGEPIVNLELRYKGYRIAGNDATRSGRVVTIASSPGWPVDFWVGYYMTDDLAFGRLTRMYQIESNTSDTITLTAEPLRWADGSWALSFDPLDAENGEPLEIKYDQVIDAKVSIQIISIDGRLIQNLNDTTKDRVANWGAGKSVFWSGEIQFGAREGREGYLISPETLFDYESKVPLVIRFKVTPLNTVEPITLLSYGVNRDGSQASTPLQGGRATLNNPFGGCKIITRVLDEGYYLGWYASGNLAGSDNHILDAGRMISYSDQGAGVYRLFIEGRGTGGYNSAPFTGGDYNGKYLMSGKSGAVAVITDSGADATNGWIEITLATDLGTPLYLLKSMGFEGTFSLWRDGDHTNVSDDAEYPWLSIVDNQHQPISFKAADNDGLGLKLRFTSPEFYVEGLNNQMFQTGIHFHPAPFGSPLGNPANFMLNADYKTVCENELTIHYEGASHIIPADSDVKLAQFGTQGAPLLDQSNVSVGIGNTYLVGNLKNNERTQGATIQIFWSKYYPTKLWMSAGNNSDAHNPEQGTFVIFEFQKTSPGAVVPLLGAGHIRCPSIAPKAKSFAMKPFLELHQLSGKIVGNLLVDHGIVTFWRPLSTSPIAGGRIDNYEFDLPESDGFIHPQDLLVTVNPKLLVAADDNEALIFWRNQTYYIPASTLWHLLIKPIIFDRVGRTPLNLPDQDVFETEDQDALSSPSFTRSDWNGISAFWDPDDGATAALVNDLGSNWMTLRNNAGSLNLARALPINIWSQ